MSVLAVAEHRRGAVRDVSYQLITAGRDLAAATGDPLHVAVVGGDADGFAEELDREGVDVVHPVDPGVEANEGEGAGEFNHDVWVQAVAALVAETDPATLVLPHSVNGLDSAPALAERLDRPLVTDAVDLAWDDGLTVTRELYGSKAETTIDVRADRAAVTLRPGEWPAAEGEGAASIEPFAPEIGEAAVRTTVTGFEAAPTGDVNITDADVLVAVGRGIGEEENLDLVFDLAEALDATVAASRPIVDSGWLPPERQVGQSGKVVTPDVYLALGISGAVQHVAGMKGAGTIVAVNTDPNAPIFDVADYGVVGDLFEVVPALIEAVE